MAVRIGTEGAEQNVTLHVVSLFRNRPGWCVIARMTEPDGANLREWELTKQFTTPAGAMDAFAEFIRTQSVESESE